MSRQKDREEFIALMMAEATQGTNIGHGVLDTLRAIMQCATRLHRIAERQCNGHQTFDGRWDEAAAKRDELAEERIQARVVKLCEPLGWVPDFQGDPRGAVVKLKVPSGRYNDWGQTGICVP